MTSGIRNLAFSLRHAASCVRRAACGHSGSLPKSEINSRSRRQEKSEVRAQAPTCATIAQAAFLEVGHTLRTNLRPTRPAGIQVEKAANPGRARHSAVMFDSRTRRLDLAAEA
jgi:hypothetical protein